MSIALPLLAGSIAVTAYSVVCPRVVHGQSAEFEVASIKPSTDAAPVFAIGPELRNGMVQGERITLRTLVGAAYGVTAALIAGPDWLDRSRFDVMAKASPGTSDADLKPMLRTLLKERFKLVAHVEKRQTAVYFLRPARGGAKMPKYPAPDRGPARPGDPKYAGFPMLRGSGTTSQLAALMSRVLNRPVIDQTGLTERYSYFLSYAPLSPEPRDRVPEFGPPDIFTAVEEQLGLKLQAGRDAVDLVVVNHIERMPTEN